MKYMSSRGKEKGLDFEDVLFAGYASDGGLYFPEKIHELSNKEIEHWSSLEYIDLVKEILKLYISETEMPPEDVNEVVEKALKDKFHVPETSLTKKGANNDKPEIIGFRKVGSKFDGTKGNDDDQVSEDVVIAELFHGPTLAFKDLALSIVGGLYQYFLDKRKQHMTLLVGTSGDTGSAAINAVKGKRWIDIIVLYPKGRCTEIQELQMTTVLDENVHNYAVDGSSDDLDEPIKEVFQDRKYVEEHHLCSINSINWARILVQMAHYAYIYFRNTREVGCKSSRVEIVIPTGACGNITAGCILRKMGIPIDLIACVNANDVVARFLKVGDYSVDRDIPTKCTWATAMDIQMPYNVERLLLLASNLNTDVVGSIMNEFDTSKAVNIPKDILRSVNEMIMDQSIVTDEEIIASMQRCYKESDYLVCPHTATGMTYHYKTKCNKEKPRVIVATASPEKFPNVTEKAIGESQHAYESKQANCRPNKVSKLFHLPTKYNDSMKAGGSWTKILREKIEEISNNLSNS